MFKHLVMEEEILVEEGWSVAPVWKKLIVSGAWILLQLIFPGMISYLNVILIIIVVKFVQYKVF